MLFGLEKNLTWSQWDLNLQTHNTINTKLEYRQLNSDTSEFVDGTMNMIYSPTSENRTLRKLNLSENRTNSLAQN